VVRGVSQRVSIDVERGAADGHQIRISGGGDEHPSYKTGDLIFRVAAAAHPRFRRDGNDLWVHHAITLRESLLGFDAQLVHLDGHTVRLRSDRVTAPHTLMRIAGEGMPVHNFPSERGALVVNITVTMPLSLSSAQKAGMARVLS